MYGNSRLKFILAICLSLIICLIFFRRDLLLLFSSDPPKQRIYELTFHDIKAHSYEQIVFSEGFINQSEGLQLAPRTKGKIIFSFSKEPNQGALLRVWFYGDRGEQRPNAIKISTNAGHTFSTVASNGNFIGSVFDITPLVAQSKQFLVMFEAENNSPFTPSVLDKTEVVIGKGASVKPSAPDIPRILGVLFLVLIICYGFLLKGVFSGRWLSLSLLLGIMLLAAYVRWDELLRVSGTLLDLDARGYREYAEKMSFFSDTGFYSAQFGLREPFFICMANIFFMLTSPSDTHLRMLSFVFSLAVVYLTYRIGREWFNEAVGLIAAFILAVHPYLISLSARGLREELFTTLLLLFIYFGHIKENLSARTRVVTCGALAGWILLTRVESLPLLVILLASYLFLMGKKWNTGMAAATLVMGMILVLPHLYQTYKRHGDPFYAINQHTRFYANIEFAGQLGFPTRDQIAQDGLYTGPKITPLEYYFKHHTLSQVVKYSAIGLAKTTCAMPGAFASGKGNLRRVMYSFAALKNNFSLTQLIEYSGAVFSLIIKDAIDYLMACGMFLSFLAGIALLIWARCWIMIVYLIAFQIQTSFVAYLGIENRLAAHAYPMIALCCGYAIAQVAMRFHPVSGILSALSRGITYIVTK